MIPKLSTIPILRLWIAVLCGYLALGATLQILPNYITHFFHSGPFMVGSIISIASLATAFIRPVAGCAADNGYARLVILISSAFAVLGGIGHWCASSLSELLVARLFLGAGEGGLFVGAVSLVIYNCSSKNSGTFAGWFGLSMWLGLCVGPILAIGFNHLFANVPIWSLVTALPVIGLILILTTSASNDAAKQQSPKRLILLPNEAILPGIAFLLASYGYGSINALLILHLEYQHLGGENIALPIFAVCFLASRLLGSPLVSFFGGRLMLMSFLIIEILGLLMISSSPLLSIVLIGTALTGIGVSMLYPAFVSVVVQLTPSTQHGAAIGFMTSFWDLGLVIAGPVGGMIASLCGFNTAFLMAAIFSLVSYFIVSIALNYSPNILSRTENQI